MKGLVTFISVACSTCPSVWDGYHLTSERTPTPPVNAGLTYVIENVVIAYSLADVVVNSQSICDLIYTLMDSGLVTSVKCVTLR